MERTFSAEIYKQLKPTWKEYLIPYGGFRSFTRRAIETIKQYYDRMSVEDIRECVSLGSQSSLKLGLAHGLETLIAVSGTFYAASHFFSR